MILQPGDKVQVKYFDELLRLYGYRDNFKCCIDTPNAIFVTAMQKYCGQIVTISKVMQYTSTDIAYKIEEDNKYYTWTEEMFEENTKFCPKCNSKLLYSDANNVYTCPNCSYQTNNTNFDKHDKTIREITIKEVLQIIQESNILTREQLSEIEGVIYDKVN